MQPEACMACKAFVIPPMALVWIALFLGITAGEVRAAAALSPCTTESYGGFDFWLGHWQVYLEDGRRAGTNLITRTADGCLVQEYWQGAGGSEGHSMNFHDPSSGRWRQVWVSSDSLIDISGAAESGQMILEGEIRYRVSGEILPFRGEWQLLEDGRVRQYFEERREDTWQPWFEGFYVKAVE